MAKTNIDWVDTTGLVITSIQQMPKDAVGFVYLIEYVDGMMYIGKKNLFTQIIKPVRKNGIPRDGLIETVKKNIKGHRVECEVILKESDWRTYQGSHKEAKIRIPSRKIILQYAFSAMELTYLEMRAQVINGVLESKKYINDNILGKFYRGTLYGKSYKGKLPENLQ